MLSAVLKLEKQPSGDSGGPSPATDSSTWAFSAEQHTPRAHQQAPSYASALLTLALQRTRDALAPPQKSMLPISKLMDAQQPHGTNSSCSMAPDRLTATQKLQQAVQAQKARQTAQAQKEALLYAEMKACSPTQSRYTPDTSFTLSWETMISGCHAPKTHKARVHAGTPAPCR